MDVMRQTQDGFEIARHDLEIRGPGEVLGTRQAGMMRMRIADLARDSHLLPQIQLEGKNMIKFHPDCVSKLLHRWIKEGEKYARV